MIMMTKQVSLGKGRASALPFFYARASGLVHPSLILDRKSAKNRKLVCFFCYLRFFARTPFLEWQKGGEARGSSDRMKTQSSGKSQTATCLQPLKGVDYPRNSDKLLYNNYERK